MRFSFIHAADLHIDSPLRGLGAKDPQIAERFAKASRKAVENLVDRTIAEEAAFLIIAGDLFDGDWKDYSSFHFFARTIGRLHRAGIPTFFVKGNHDADSQITRPHDFPVSVRVFPSSKAGTEILDDIGVAIHGRSFPNRLVPLDFVAGYPKAQAGLFNIGVLHTSLDGARGHDTYAGCTAEDLGRFGYDYWALGHIHGAAEIPAAHGRIVYPGNIQGRSVREPGPKGAMRVVVEDGRIVEIQPLVLDAARWEIVSLDISECEDDLGIFARIDAATAAAHAAADGRPLAIRVHLTGTSPLHPHLVATRELVLAQARANAFAIADDCWIEQLRVETHAPERTAGLDADALDIEGLLDLTAQEGSFETVLGDLARSIAGKMPRELSEEFLRDQDAALRRMKAIARDQIVGELTAARAASR